MWKKADIFREGDKWFMHLEYEYEDSRGKHLVILPKVDLPYPTKCVPNVDFCNRMITDKIEKKLGYKARIVDDTKGE